jgi:hypothetical protein
VRPRGPQFRGGDTCRTPPRQGRCSAPTPSAALSFQPFPTRGRLARRLDSPLGSLRRVIPTVLQECPLYVYIVTSAKVLDGAFAQTGSGPNFQGGFITLCTCKHKDRASPPKPGCRGSNPNDPWKGVWVAGLCSPSQARPRGLFYLMLVERTFASHAACWTGLGHPSQKSAHRHPFGDVYEPRASASGSPWTEASYKDHLPEHCHDSKGRRTDIEVSYYTMKRHPRLLVGDPEWSFLWRAPRITLTPHADTDWATAHHRFYQELSDFLPTLR